MNYIPLNVKTHYELLSSLIKVEDLISFASSNSLSAVGITDTNMFSAMEFITLCKKNNIKPILGVPFNIDNLDMILYAKNYEGYLNLVKLVSIRNIDKITKEDFKKHKDNLICVTNDYTNYLDYKEIYVDVYLSYENITERTNALTITDKIVFLKESRYFLDNDKEYLTYLYLIKDGKTIEDMDQYSFDSALDIDIDEYDAKTTKDFSDLINIEMPTYKYKLPEYSPNKVELLSDLCNKGLNKRLNGNVTNEYLDRLNIELNVIKDMEFTDYFLIVYDFILYAKKNGIVIGPGRGSAAGSLVCYCLGITEIDPLKYNLIFERFLNKDRVTMPDIDVDIEYLRRDEVVNYVKEKYGKDNVANIITFGTLQTKQAIRDVSRVLKISNSIVDMLIKTINDKENMRDLEKNQAFVSIVENDPELKKLYRICKKLEGLKRHTSIHAAGVIISDEPLTNKVPLYNSSGTILTSYTMEYLESIGLLKIDFLAIKNLTIIDIVVKLIEKNKNIKVNINKVPLNDKKTLDIFYNSNTEGIFQFESEGMKNFLRSLKVRSFDDLVNAIALYRPGPMDNISNFIAVREGRKKADYIIPELDEILKSTNGIIIYQEQILDVLKKIGGFTYSEADIIRRAMSKKKEDVIIKYKEDFINGACLKGIDKQKAKDIYNLILKFANYGFNKSHSVAYSFVSYQMAFLKAHFPEYFMMTLLNDAIGNISKTKEYFTESKQMGLTFDKPNILLSTTKYEIIGDKVLFPLNSIKNITKDIATTIINARNEKGFDDFIDFVKNVYSSKINQSIIESLIYSGCLDSFNINKRTMIENLSAIVDYASLCNELGEENVLKPELIVKEEYSKPMLLKKEFEYYGFYINNHPVSRYSRNGCVKLNEIKMHFDQIINTIGLVEKIKVIETKKNEKMAFVVISDDEGKTTLVLFPKIFESIDIHELDIVSSSARVEKRMSEYQLVVNKIQKLD